ncbi:MAG TPA: alanine--tRNA ligase [Candidatus Paceibacterota bacterium]|nr:alanine--tRNA ligase [Candidatus Paceibacterota bacterium]
MESNEIRSRFLAFYKERKHAIIPSASLVPENDPTTLFTGSGMQPLVPYLLGAAHPEGRRLADSEKCFRAEDIDEVGDNRHTTFFEMLGNWSLGDYFKEEQLGWIFEFLTDKEKGAGLDPDRLYVTVFAGDEATGIPADEESVKIWKRLFKEKKIKAEYVALGSEAEGSEKGMRGGRIFSYDVKKNWWSRAGVPSKMPAGEPGGPDSEIFYDFDPSGAMHDQKFGNQCHPNCECGRFLEIGNSVFMEYKKRDDGAFEKLSQRNVDFGGGLERITAAANRNADIFKIDVLWTTIAALEKEFGKKYDASPATTMAYRVIADHIRAAVFLVGDGVVPSNKERGYVLRRLIRKAVFEAHRLGSDSAAWTRGVGSAVVDEYGSHYAGLAERRDAIVSELEKEGVKFLATMEAGLKIFNDIVKTESERHPERKRITADDAFLLFATYGFPIELTREKAEEIGFTIDLAGFAAKLKEHQDRSRTATAGTFKGGLADMSERTIRLHTAHHLLLKALQVVLGKQVKQRGSNITSERLRMDFSYDGKMTDEQKKEVEAIVNEKIAEDLPVTRSEMGRDDAEKLGAEHEFGQKYPDRVSVYSIGPKGATEDKPHFEKAFSIEFCGGPHVAHTGEIGRFKLVKEEAVAHGIRRVRGTIE